MTHEGVSCTTMSVVGGDTTDGMLSATRRGDPEGLAVESEVCRGSPGCVSRLEAVAGHKMQYSLFTVVDNGVVSLTGSSSKEYP